MIEHTTKLATSTPVQVIDFAEGRNCWFDEDRQRGKYCQESYASIAEVAKKLIHDRKKRQHEKGLIAETQGTDDEMKL